MSWIAEQCDFSKSWAYACKYNTLKIKKNVRFIINQQDDHAIQQWQFNYQFMLFCSL